MNIRTLGAILEAGYHIQPLDEWMSIDALQESNFRRVISMVYCYLQHGPVGHTLFFNLRGEKLGTGTNSTGSRHMGFSSCSTRAQQLYVISAPKVFCVGAFENIVIQVYGYTEEFDATISIKSYPDKKFTYSSGHVTLSTVNKFQNSALLTIQPKQLSGGQDPVSHVYLDVVSKHFSKSKKMPITYDNGFLFIHTDKPVYTPHQSVKVRVYSLNDDLKPAKRETVLTFIDPEGSEVDMVEENDYTGIISFPDFKIPSNPKYGVWTIRAKYKEDFSTTGTAYFEIKEYVMPHFSISIETENNFIGYKDFNNFEITIKAR
ncbi:hypothetical protein J1605_019803 [Eschrichtius robustus]|uniref:Complement C5 n=1 Tax=Eschrichtius robustus TaxID=9764 RepID=A0AB34HM60_ESCRO|nr:hypothetical protein J1605_019803 [Eschrichtius robustus]